MLGELAQMAMVVARAYAASAVAAAHAVEVILADEFWQPETGRARALAGSRDAAEAFQKVSRALRLTLVLEKTTAETIRDLRAGVVREPRVTAAVDPAHRDRSIAAGSIREEPGDPAPNFDGRGPDTERLHDIERPDRPLRGSFQDSVSGLCADIGVAPDWDGWRIGAPEARCRPRAEDPTAPFADRGRDPDLTAITSQRRPFPGQSPPDLQWSLPHNPDQSGGP